VLADCERALGRPERAIDLFRTAERDKLGREDAIELLIVAAGARADLGQHEAAVAMLQVRELTSGDDEWAARLRYAYADSLLAGGRSEEAREWFARAAEVDEDSVTDAAERLLELDGVALEDDDDDLDEEDGEPVTGSTDQDDTGEDGDAVAHGDADREDEDGDPDSSAAAHGDAGEDEDGDDLDSGAAAYGDAGGDEDDERRDLGASETRAAPTAGLDLGAADDARVSDPVPAGRGDSFAVIDADELAEELAVVEAEEGRDGAGDDDPRAVAPATAGPPDVTPDADLGDPATGQSSPDPADGAADEVAAADEPDDDNKTLPEAGLIDAAEDSPGDASGGGAQGGTGTARA
jgi:hypothetical protein